MTFLNQIRSLHWLRPMLGAILGWLCAFSLAAADSSVPVGRPLALPTAALERLSNAPPSSPWAILTPGTRTFGGVTFDLQGVIRLAGMTRLRAGEWAPSEVVSIPVGQRFTGLNLLHGLEGHDREGTPAFSVVWRYQDGSTQVTRMSVGLQTASSFPQRNESPVTLRDPGSVIVDVAGESGQNGGGNGPRLFRTRILNPHPDLEVVSIDLLSLFPSASPVVLAVTLDSEPAVRTVATGRGKNRLERRASAASDEVLRGVVRLDVRSAAGGAVVPGARVYFSCSSDEPTYFLADRTTGEDGTVQVAYPALHTVVLSALVTAPGFAPQLVTFDRFRDHGIPKVGRVDLAPGGVFGGVVNDPSGHPIEGADVRLFQYHSSSSSSRDLTRIDYPSMKTDREGRWSGTTLPESLTNAELVVEHPDYATVRLRVTAKEPSTPKVGIWLAQLKSKQATTTLTPGGKVQIVVTSGEGRPISGASVTTLPARGKAARRLGTTDAVGRFSISPLELVSIGRCAVLSPGFAPGVVFSEAVFSSGDAAPTVPLVLLPTQPMRGTIRDQNQTPVPGVMVRVDAWNDSDLVNWSGVTDVAGQFLWTNAAPGLLSFRLSKTNYLRSNYQMSWQGGEVSFFMQRQSMASGRVVDAETRRPIPDFSVVLGIAYSSADMMRWDRYRTTRGRNGFFTTRPDNYGSSARYAFMIEAPGYVPVISEEFSQSQPLEGEYQLKKGRGLAGQVLDVQGNALPGASVILVEPPDLMSMDKPGTSSRSGNWSDQTRADAQGKFELQPRLHPGRVIVVTSSGIADVSTSELASNGVVRLEPWGRIEGDFKVGSRLQPNQSVRLQTTWLQYASPEERGQGVSLDLKPVLSAEGHFVFEKVPPGFRTVSVEHKFSDRRNAPYALSHEVVVEVKPGETSKVVLGGTGRTVTGKIRILGDPDAVDWLADKHELRFQPPTPVGMPTLSFGPNETPQGIEEKQKGYQKRVEQFYRTPEGRAFQLAQRSYFLVFNTNGQFHADNVPPGSYFLNVTPNEQQTGDYYSYNQLGSLQQQVEVTDGGTANAPQDLGTFDLRIRSSLKVGKRVPEFSLTTFEGKTLTRDSLAGKPAVIYFWASWAGGKEADLPTLKSLASTLVKQEKITILVVNVDNEKRSAEQGLKDFPEGVIHCYGGSPQGVSDVALSLGIEGYPACVVIDAAGRTVSQNCRAGSIQTFANKALRSRLPTNKLPDAAKPVN